MLGKEKGTDRFIPFQRALALSKAVFEIMPFVYQTQYFTTCIRKCFHDCLSLTVCQPLWVYFTPSVKRIAYHIYQPLRSGRIWHKVNFEAEFNRFEFRVLPLQDKPALLFTHSWRENNWIHTFPKDISAMWNAISLVQDLNSCHRAHFLRR